MNFNRRINTSRTAIIGEILNEALRDKVTRALAKRTDRESLIVEIKKTVRIDDSDKVQASALNAFCCKYNLYK